LYINGHFIFEFGSKIQVRQHPSSGQSNQKPHQYLTLLMGFSINVITFELNTVIAILNAEVG